MEIATKSKKEEARNSLSEPRRSPREEGVLGTVGNDMEYQDVLYFDGESDGIYPKRLKNLNGSTVQNSFQVTGEALTSADYLDVKFTATNHGIIYTPYNKREHMKVNNRKLSEF